MLNPSNFFPQLCPQRDSPVYKVRLKSVVRLYKVPLKVIYLGRVRDPVSFQLPVAPARSSTEHASFWKPDPRSWLIWLCKFRSTSFLASRISRRGAATNYIKYATAKRSEPKRYSAFLSLPSRVPLFPSTRRFPSSFPRHRGRATQASPSPPPPPTQSRPTPSPNPPWAEPLWRGSMNPELGFSAADRARQGVGQRGGQRGSAGSRDEMEEQEGEMRWWSRA
jgi:hypothetical protein